MRKEGRKEGGREGRKEAKEGRKKERKDRRKKERKKEKTEDEDMYIYTHFDAANANVISAHCYLRISAILISLYLLCIQHHNTLMEFLDILKIYCEYKHNRACIWTTSSTYIYIIYL
jgi:hypothetical protein